MSRDPQQATDGAQPFAGLTPERIIEAVEATGIRCDGHLLALNSYENRVYRLGVEDQAPVVAKFYRAGRWDDAAILEEHRFTLDLAEADIGVVAPLVSGGRSLFEFGGFLYALYPLRNGRPPELESETELQRIGRTIARLHNLGAIDRFRHRPRLQIDNPDEGASRWLLDHDWVPPSVRAAYASVAADLLQAMTQRLRQYSPFTELRLHGDAHPGNLLSRDGELLLVDFDDAMTGPAVQDLWLFLAGDREEQALRLQPLLAGYTEFRDFDPRELGLIEALRSLRIIRHSAWIARRWDDPAFPQAFPWFDSPRYWDEQVLTLREQLALLYEPPPAWLPF